MGTFGRWMARAMSLWDYDNAYAIRSTAACADLNNDGNNEVIVGATCTADNPTLLWRRSGRPAVHL